MKVSYKNIEVEIKDENLTVIDAFKEAIEEKENVIACMVNNEVKPLDYVLKQNDEVELLNTSSRDGARIYTRGLLFIMGMAFNELYPEIKLTVNFQLSSSMFCKIEKDTITEEMIKNVKARMQEIIDKNLKIKKVEMSKEEATEFLEKENTGIGKIQIENKEKETVSLYFCEEYYNYFYGVMPIFTGYIKLFDIMKYHDGFLIRYPSKNKPNEIKPYQEGKKLLATLEEYDDIYRILGIATLSQLNEKIRNGEAKDIILLSEALHEKKIANIADKIIEDRKKRVILIAGPSSSGKTTFAKRLGIQLKLNGLKPKTISVDNYFVEREQTPKDEFGNYNFEALEAVDLKLLNEHLVKLLNGEEIEVPTFDFKKGTKYYTGKTMKLEDDEVLVMEGIHCLNDELTPAIDKNQKFKIYISALTALNIDDYNRISTTDSRLLRRMLRDSKYRSHSATATLKMWPSVRRGEEKYIFPYQEEADVMFNSSLVYEIAVLKTYVEPLLADVGRDEPEFSEAKRLYEFLGYFLPIEKDDIPINSIIREFIGGGCFYR